MTMRFFSGVLLTLALIVTITLVATGDGSPAQQPEPYTGSVMLTADNPILIRAGQTDERLDPLRSRVDFSRAPQSAEIIVQYNGPWDSQARAAFEYATSIWEHILTSQVPIIVSAEWVPLDFGILGGAGPYYNIRNFANTPINNTWYPAALANSIAGVDLNASLPDVKAQFNSARPDWYFGIDGNPPGNRYDFVTVVLHELGHGLGFTGTMNFDDGNFSNGFECFGSANYGCWGFFNGQPTDSPGVFDRLTQNGFMQSLTNISLFGNPSFELANQLRGNSLFFAGTAATAANNGILPRLWAPPTWEPGSSYAHLDELTYPAASPNALMTPILANGEVLHDPGAITRGIFADIGWGSNSPPVLLPLPSQLLLLGRDKIGAIDLWQFTTDEQTPVNELSYAKTIDTDLLAGVTIHDNRYVDIRPTHPLPIECDHRNNGDRPARQQ